MAQIDVDQSRGLQVRLTTPVVVYGYTESGIPFEEGTSTTSVSADGGSIELITPVRNEQLLVLKNLKTKAEILCHVVTRIIGENGPAHATVGFDNPSPHFWGLTFSLED